MTALWILFSSFCSACILASIQCLKETLAFIDVAFVQFMFVLAVTVVVMIIVRSHSQPTSGTCICCDPSSAWALS